MRRDIWTRIKRLFLEITTEITRRENEKLIHDFHFAKMFVWYVHISVLQAQKLFRFSLNLQYVYVVFTALHFTLY